MKIRKWFEKVSNHETKKALIANLNRTHEKELRFYERLDVKDKKSFRLTAEKEENSLLMAIVNGINLNDNSKPKKYWENLIEINRNELEELTKYRLDDWCSEDYVIPTDLDYSTTHFEAVDNFGRKSTWRKNLLWDYFEPSHLRTLTILAVMCLCY